MLTLCSFLQNAFFFVRSLIVRVTKSDYRNKAVFLCAGLILSVTVFNSSGFGGGGRNAVTVFAGTGQEKPEEDEETEENKTAVTEAEVQIEPADPAERESEEGQKKQNIPADPEGKEQKNGSDSSADLKRTEQNEGQKLVGQTLVREVRRQERQKAAAANMLLNRLEDADDETTEKADSTVAYSEEDYQVLLRIVQAEAGICDDKGKILVANVILNRVKSEKFPDTIKEVVYQKSQFSPVRNGGLARYEPSRETIDCVNRALAGEDYSQGALYFMYRGGSETGAARWFDRKLTYLFQHERHEFFK